MLFFAFLNCLTLCESLFLLIFVAFRTFFILLQLKDFNESGGFFLNILLVLFIFLFKAVFFMRSSYGVFK